MSILPISGHIQTALSLFTLTGVAVIDTQYTRIDGMDIKTEVIRSKGITAAVDPSSMKQLEKIFGGDVSDGDVMIYSKDTLYILDQTDSTTRKQSYLTYQGTIYRIMNSADWTPQAGVFVYQGRRHVTQL